MTIQKTSIGAALPLLLNPATLCVVAIGALGWKIYNQLLEDEEDDSPAVPTLQTNSQATAQLETATKASEEVETCPNSDERADDEERNQIIRQAMSELGKRSAAARAKRKAAASEGAKAAI